MVSSTHNYQKQVVDLDNVDVQKYNNSIVKYHYFWNRYVSEVNGNQPAFRIGSNKSNPIMRVMIKKIADSARENLAVNQSTCRIDFMQDVWLSREVTEVLRAMCGAIPRIDKHIWGKFSEAIEIILVDAGFQC